MKELIIKNMWINENGAFCEVYWHYINGDRPYVTISNYNPFPFYCRNQKDGKLYSSVNVFNDWMLKNGWKPIMIPIIEKVSK